MGKIKFVLSLILFIPFILVSQTWCDDKPEIVKQRLYHVVEVLSHDTLKGREAGTEEDYKAALFIASFFEEMGLQSIFPDGRYLQPFMLRDGIIISHKNSMMVNNQLLKLRDDFFPLNVSANAHVRGEAVRVGYGVSIPEQSYNDYENRAALEDKVFVIQTGLPSSLNNKDNVLHNYESIEYKVNMAMQHGAKAVVFFDATNRLTYSQLNRSSQHAPFSIPVVFASGRAQKIIMDAPVLNVEMYIELEDNLKKSYNVIGYLNNNAPRTIVIGGHYDHLGVREIETRRSKKVDIYNGADDNASGVSLVIELARRMVCKAYKKNNILFIAFGAEEKGLLGSNFFVNSNAYELDKMNYMLNIDMVGRIDTNKSKLNIIGTGSSSLWDSIIDATPSPHFDIRKSTSATGGSDHASFYLKNMPVLFFFTGIHSDYHTPDDVIEKLNFTGIYNILNYVYDFVLKTDIAHIPFAKAETTNIRSARRSSTISLGIMPDHAYEYSGIRIADITQQGPAEKAGLQRGDIIIKIGMFQINDIHTYMSALATFKTGDKTSIDIIRDEELLTLELVF